MKYIYFFSLFLFYPTVHAMWLDGIDFDRHMSVALSLFESTEEKLKKMGNTYDPAPLRNEPLIKERVMNAYWQKIATQDQAAKDEALISILKLDFPDFSLPLKRFHMAGALYAGAHPHCRSYDHSPLHDAVVHNDYDLCKLALECGASPNWKERITHGHPIAYFVKTCAMAELFVKHGIDITDKNLHPDFWFWLSRSEVEPGLISLWIKQGLSVYSADDRSPLHKLADEAKFHEPEHIIAKVQALFHGLTHDEIISLIKQPWGNGTAITMLQDYRNEGSSALFAFLNSYLIDEKKSEPQEIFEQDIECPICSDNPADSITPCIHAFCQSCIKTWLAKNQTCPTCRTPVIAENLIKKKIE